MILRSAVVILLMMESGMLSMLADQHLVPLFCILISIFLYFKPLQYQVALSVKVLVPASLVGYFCFRAVSLDGITLDRTDFVFPVWVTNSLGECFLIGQIFELIKKRNSRDGLLNFCMLAMACIVCACSRFATLTERSLLFIGAIICVTLICVIFQYSTRSFAKEALSRRQYTSRSSLIAITMLTVGLGTWYLSGFLRGNIEGFQEWWVENVTNQISGFAATEIKYSQSATLENITNLKKSNPMNPVLHVYSQTPPGYLRGASYTRFDGKSWGKSNQQKYLSVPSMASPPVLEEPGLNVYPVQRDPQSTRYKKIAIENIDSLYVFTPLHVDFYSAKTKGVQNDKFLFVNWDGTLRNVDQKSIYSGYVGNLPAISELSPQAAIQLSENYFGLEPEVTILALEITKSDSTDKQRIASIESFFSSNYSYSTDQKKFPADRDRLSYFIRERPAAHCEFFGSAAVAILRANGIPARYVTGFGAMEKSTEEDYYVARNRDAHAWAEAYDRDQGKWVIVEATPGVNFPKDVWENDDVGDSDDGESNVDITADGNRFQFSFFFQGIWIQVREFFEEIGRQLRGPLNIVITLLILFGVFYRYWWKPRRDPLYGSRGSMLEAQFRKAERILARYRLVRNSNETLWQFERRIRAEVDMELERKLEPVLQWLRQYETLRYGFFSSSDAIPAVPRI